MNYEYLNESEYDKRLGLRSSFLKKILSHSVVHALTPSETTDALDFGILVHNYILEHDAFKNKFAILPNADGRSKEVKEFKDKNIGKEFIKFQDGFKLALMRESVLNHSIANQFFGTESKYELSFFSKLYSLDVKCRTDIITPTAIIDLKTTKNANYDSFIKDIFNYGYHISAAFYLDIVKQFKEYESIQDFYILAIEKDAPFAINIFKFSETELNIGRYQYKDALKRYQYHLELKDFLGDSKLSAYPERIIEVKFYDWMLSKIHNELGY